MAHLNGFAPEKIPRSTYDGPWIPSQDFLDDLPRLMDLVSLPGLIMSTVEDGKVVWTQAVGLSNVENATPMHENSVVEAASLTKPVFAYVVLKLTEEGVIDLDRPLTQYYRPAYLADHPDIDLITARHVLTHSTGFPNWRSNPEEQLAPSFKPGSRFGYSGEGFQWLQIVVEHLTGVGVDAIMRSRLFDPAGMPLSTLGWTEEIAPLTVYGYRGPDDDGEVKIGSQFKRDVGPRLLSTAAELGKTISEMTHEEIEEKLPEAKGITNVAGMMSTTTAEYAYFMTLMMDRPQRESWEISEANLREMLSHQRTRRKSMHWGLGWPLEEGPSGLLYYHSGMNSGIFATYAVGDPARRRAFVVFTNGGDGGDVYQPLVRNAINREMLDFIL